MSQKALFWIWDLRYKQRYGCASSLAGVGLAGCHQVSLRTHWDSYQVFIGHMVCFVSSWRSWRWWLTCWLLCRQANLPLVFLFSDHCICMNSFTSLADFVFKSWLCALKAIQCGLVNVMKYHTTTLSWWHQVQTTGLFATSYWRCIYLVPAMCMHYTIPKWVFLVLAPYLYVAYLHGTKAFLVDNLLLVFCKCLLEISRCLETKESVFGLYFHSFLMRLFHKSLQVSSGILPKFVKSSASPYWSVFRAKFNELMFLSTTYSRL